MTAKIVQTLGEIGPNWIVELVADRDRPERTKLLYWDGTTERIESRLALALSGQAAPSIYEPAEIHPNVLRAIHLPDRAAPYGSTRELFESVSSTVRKFTSLSDDSVALLVQAVLASWVVEATEVPICVALVGPMGPERRQVLRLLRCLFRRALVLSGVTLNNLSVLPMDLTPSLLIEHVEASNALQTFLHVTSSPEGYVAARGQLVNLCCAKVFCIEDPMDRCLRDLPILEIPLPSSDSSPPFLDPRAQKEILDEFQPKLLKYRLANFGKVRDARSSPMDLRTPFRDVVACLSASAAGDSELQTSVATLVKKQEVASTLDSEKLFEKVVLEATLRLCHQTKENTLTVGAIARMANGILVEKGETLTLHPRAVGSILRTLRIPTEGLGDQGRGITLLKRVREKIHAIASDHGVILTLTNPGDCQICWEADPESEMSADLSKMTPEELDGWY